MMDVFAWVVEWDNFGQTVLWPLLILFWILFAIALLIKDAAVAVWEWIVDAIEDWRGR